MARQRAWLLSNFGVRDAKALVTMLMKLDAKQIETLRRMVEQTKGN